MTDSISGQLRLFALLTCLLWTGGASRRIIPEHDAVSGADVLRSTAAQACHAQLPDLITLAQWQSKGRSCHKEITIVTQCSLDRCDAAFMQCWLGRQHDVQAATLMGEPETLAV